MIDPIAFHIGPLAVRWYGLSYLLGLLLGILILSWLNEKRPVFKDRDQIFDFAFWMFFLGVLIGGRMGYVLFYNLPYFVSHPAEILAVWQGGMSFHGGLIGSALVAYFFFKKHRIDFWKAADLVVIPGALALTFTRLANFVNQELYGTVIQHNALKWMGMDFGDGLLRYPTQLIQSGSAFLLFLILLFIFFQKPRKGVLLSSYLILHGLFRFLVEFIRAPDPQIGYLFGITTLGQILGVLTLIAGFLLLWLSRRP